MRIAALEALDWPAIAAALDARGHAVLGPLLDPVACRGLAALYDEPRHFRSRIVMQRHAFGRGEYQYFAYPLPAPVAALRSACYPPLAAVASRWAARLGREPFPADLEGFLARCRAAGQRRPTPLLLRYGPEDFNCLHQDLYGALAFPLQMTVLLSRPEVDFEGGELVLVEQRPRAQSRAEVVRLKQGEAVIFAVDERPAEGTRGPYRVKLRHGVSRVLSGQRHALGIIFHDAA